MHMILCSLNDDILATMSKIDDPRVAWETLNAEYSVPNSSSKMNYTILSPIHFDENEPVENYIKQIRSIVTQRARLGARVDGDDHVQIVLKALLESYGLFVMSLTANGGSPSFFGFNHSVGNGGNYPQYEVWQKGK